MRTAFGQASKNKEQLEDNKLYAGGVDFQAEPSNQYHTILAILVREHVLLAFHTRGRSYREALGGPLKLYMSLARAARVAKHGKSATLQGEFSEPVKRMECMHEEMRPRIL
jgi:hypothetical protein